MGFTPIHLPAAKPSISATMEQACLNRAVPAPNLTRLVRAAILLPRSSVKEADLLLQMLELLLLQ